MQVIRILTNKNKETIYGALLSSLNSLKLVKKDVSLRLKIKTWKRKV